MTVWPTGFRFLSHPFSFGSSCELIECIIYIPILTVTLILCLFTLYVTRIKVVYDKIKQSFFVFYSSHLDLCQEQVTE